MMIAGARILAMFAGHWRPGKINGGVFFLMGFEWIFNGIFNGIY